MSNSFQFPDLGRSAPPKTRDWESTLKSWGSPPAATEREKCERAEAAIRKAIRASESLAARDVRVFPQGSYRNRTNVRQESDVDICVLCTDSFFFDLPAGATPAHLGINTPASYTYQTFKRDVGDALVAYLGQNAVTRGRKAFDVHENTYRVDADVVPCFECRIYGSDGTYTTGTAFLPDSGIRTVNFPEQNYENGVAKNEATGRRFKAMVRALKRLRNEMLDRNIAAAEPIPSYLIECLVWNVPSQTFNHQTYLEDLRCVLAFLGNETYANTACKEWPEINGIKYLLHPTQPWSREHVLSFLQAAWAYVGFE